MSSYSLRGPESRPVLPAIAERSATNVVLISSFFVLALYTQRLRLPGTAIPLASLLIVSLLIVMFRRDARLPSGAALVFACTLASLATMITLIGSIRGTTDGSVRVLAAITFTWIVVAFSPSLDLSSSDRRRYRSCIAWSILVSGALGYFQLVLQLVPGGRFIDLSDYIGSQWLMPGFLVTSGFGQYGTHEGLHRINGFIYLEPSFAGQFYAIGALMFLSIGSFWALPLAILVVFTGSGTGTLFLLVGILVSFLGLPLRSKIMVFVGFLGAYVIGNRLGLLVLLAGRTSEFSESGSSGSIRFIAPFDHLFYFWNTQSMVAFLGWGSGSAGRLRDIIGSDANYSFVPYSMIELGVVGLIIAVMILWRLSQTSLPLAPKVAFLLLVLLSAGVYGDPAIALVAFCILAGLGVDRAASVSPNSTGRVLRLLPVFSVSRESQGSQLLSVLGR